MTLNYPEQVANSTDTGPGGQSFLQPPSQFVDSKGALTLQAVNFVQTMWGRTGGGREATLIVTDGVTGGGPIGDPEPISLDNSDARNVDHEDLFLTAGTGLISQGDIAASVTLAVDYTNVPIEDFPLLDEYYVAIDSGNGLRKSLLTNFFTMQDRVPNIRAFSGDQAPGQRLLSGDQLEGEDKRIPDGDQAFEWRARPLRAPEYATEADLPTADEVGIGSVAFVTSLDTLVFTNSSGWQKLDYSPI